MSSTFSQFFLLLCLPALGSSHALNLRRTTFSSSLTARASQNIPPEGYVSPPSRDGSMLTSVPGTFPAGLGEPINIILSANSDSSALIWEPPTGGVLNYYQAVGFSTECLGQHQGSDQAANLGDGNGYLNETAVIRWDYGDPTLGTCTETAEGGNHFRFWIQNGPQANTGAIFMALSYEEPSDEEHDIIENGYNLGRDQFIGNATGQAVNSSLLVNGTTFSGSASAAGFTYQTDVLYVSGLLQNTSNGINHYLTVAPPNGTAEDGLVAVLTVKITSQPSATSDSPRSYFTWIPLTLLPLLLAAIFIS